MAAASSLVRSLLALACFALLFAVSNAWRRSNNLPNCAEYLAGRSTTDAIVMNLQTTNEYQKLTRIHHEDNCFRAQKRLVGALIKACDPIGPPSPAIQAINIQDQLVQCLTDGPCPSGITVTVSQYCE